jgi:hypothetical protein
MVDAFPEKAYTGTVMSVANIGEQLPNADAKVFEVQIEVDGSDPILRPSMTTGNKIITKTISDVTYIALESVQAGVDSIPFVYMKNGTKQVVVLGESNENNVVVEQGLEPGIQFYLSTPANPESFKMVGLDLITVIKDREKARKAEEMELRKEAEKAKEQRSEGFGGGMPGGRGQGGGMPNMTPEMMQRFQQMRGQGGQGAQGARGAQGEQGVQGARGAQGEQAGQGAQGGARDTTGMAARRAARGGQQGVQGGQQGAPRDTTGMAARRRARMQQQQSGQSPEAPAQRTINN